MRKIVFVIKTRPYIAMSQQKSTFLKQTSRFYQRTLSKLKIIVNKSNLIFWEDIIWWSCQFFQIKIIKMYIFNDIPNFLLRNFFGIS